LLSAAPPQGAVPSEGFVNAERLQMHCNADEDDPDGLRGICLGYLAGSVDQLIGQADTSREATPLFCPANDLSLEQVRTVFLDYLEGRPEHADYTAASVIEIAMVSAYPCPQSSGGWPDFMPASAESIPFAGRRLAAAPAMTLVTATARNSAWRRLVSFGRPGLTWRKARVAPSR
jgi:hypothetical protein